MQNNNNLRVDVHHDYDLYFVPILALTNPKSSLAVEIFTSLTCPDLSQRHLSKDCFQDAFGSDAIWVRVAILVASQVVRFAPFASN